MKRPLFVFAGQSNMMGAAVLPPKNQINYKYSFEYLHKAKRFGCAEGEYKTFGFPVGEFSYIDIKAAYGDITTAENKSTLSNYRDNAYFGPSMNNLKCENDRSVSPFISYSEFDNRCGVSLAPYIVEQLEKQGYCCAYTHIAKGGVPIKYFLEGDAAEYFYQKVADFFKDAEFRFAEDDISDKVLLWLQGESDAARGYNSYYDGLEKLWNKSKALGFTKLMIVRVDPFGNNDIVDVMRAQEDFCKNVEDAYMITRVASYLECYRYTKLPYVKIVPEFLNCRDSCYGYDNEHINEQGFKVISKYATPNIIRVLFENAQPVLEEELVLALADKI